MAQPRETLARIHLFRSLGEAGIRELDARCLWRRYAAGTEILSQGEGGADVYFVLSGAVRVRLRPAEPNEAVISPPPYHADLAARVSTHREAVTRELNALERAGLLERRRGALVIRDVAALAALLERAAEGPVERERQLQLFRSRRPSPGAYP